MLGQSEVVYASGETETLVKLWDARDSFSTSQSCQVNSLDIAIEDYKALLKAYRVRKLALQTLGFDELKRALAEKLVSKLEQDLDASFTSQFLAVRKLR